MCGKGGVHGEGGMCGKGGHVWQRGACVAKGGMCGKGGHVWQRGACVAGVCVWQGAFMAGGGHVLWWGRGGSCVAGEMSTAVDGRYPTGMHSCWVYVYIEIRETYFVILWSNAGRGINILQ